MATFYKFVNGKGKAAMTSDKTGLNLPKADGPWTPSTIGHVKEISGDKDRIGAPDSEIIEEVGKSGYFVLPKEA